MKLYREYINELNRFASLIINYLKEEQYVSCYHFFCLIVSFLIDKLIKQLLFEIPGIVNLSQGDQQVRDLSQSLLSQNL